MCDYYSKWIYFKFTPNIDSKSIIDFLDSCFSLEDLPHTLVSDNGKQLVSEKMVTFLKQRGIQQEKTHVTRRNPMDKLKVNRFLKDSIQMALAAGYPVKAFTQERVDMYNNTVHSVTGHLPFFLMRGRQGITVLSPKFPNFRTNCSKAVEIQDLHLKVKDRILRQQVKSKEYHDKVHRATVKDIVKGDWVIAKKLFVKQKCDSVL